MQLNCAEGLPEAVSEELLQDDAFLQRFHHALLEVRAAAGAAAAASADALWCTG
jgi:multifunctional methyltransferase subunit TRM112